jgi:hypothetical protein
MLPEEGFSVNRNMLEQSNMFYCVWNYLTYSEVSILELYVISARVGTLCTVYK